MLIPGQNQLTKPEIVNIEPFETLLADFKRHIFDTLAAHDPQLAERVADTLGNESEVITKLTEAFITYIQTRDRAYNERIPQMLAWWATGSSLDAKLADLGLVRQMIDPGDPNAYPPVPPRYESDERARLRYYLAPHAPAAGSRTHYRHEVLTLDDRAHVTVETPAAGKVVVTYTLDKRGDAARIKDGNGRMIAPGRVAVTVLARDGDGTPDAALLDAVRDHFDRPDVAPGSDDIVVRGADIVPYAIDATVYINPGPDADLMRASALKALRCYVDERHALGERIERSWIDYVLHNEGAARLDVREPKASIITNDQQAPYCTSITIDVKPHDLRQ